MPTTNLEPRTTNQRVFLHGAIYFAVFAAQVALWAGEVDRSAKVEVALEGLPKKVTFKAKELYERAAYLASDECEGRMAGSPGQAKAREYMIRKLKDAGFEEVRRFPFEFVADVKLGKENSLSASFDGEYLKEKAAKLPWYREPKQSKHVYGDKIVYGCDAYRLDTDFLPLRISKSTPEYARSSLLPGMPPFGIWGPLLFAGYGISAPEKGYDDYAGLDAKGKVVLVIADEPETADGRRIGDPAPGPGERGVKPDPHRAPSVYSNSFYKAATTRDKGAAALVIVKGKRGLSDADRATLESFERGGGRTDCGIPFVQVFPEVADDWLRMSGKTIPELQKAIDENLKPQSFAVNGVTVSLKVDIERTRATDENLAVVLPGNDPVLRDEIVVIGAHYDHLGRGNEFSLAGKEGLGQIHYGADDNASGTASVLSIAAALRKNRAALKRTVWIMFFGAEELGTLGSNDFVKSPPPDFKLANVAAMLNLDMVGRCREKKVMIYGAATGTGFEDVLKAANHDYGLDIKTTADGFGGSDQTAFVNAGVPVLFFFTGSHADYHRPSDTPEKLNVNDQAAITALVYRTAASLINAPERPRFVKVETKQAAGIGGVRLGSIPDYAYEGKGVRLSGTAAGSPADKAGLKSGDIVTKLGEKNIENIYDYTNAIRLLLPGVATKIVIQREGKTVEIKITPERR